MFDILKSPPSVEKAAAIVTRARARHEAAQAGAKRAQIDLGRASISVEFEAAGSEAAYKKALAAHSAACSEVSEATAALAAADELHAEAVAAAYEQGVKDKAAAMRAAVQELAAVGARADAAIDALAAVMRDAVAARDRIVTLAPESNVTQTIIQAQIAFGACLGHRLKFYPGIRAPLFPDPRLDRWTSFLPDPAMVSEAAAKTTKAKPGAAGRAAA